MGTTDPRRLQHDKQILALRRLLFAGAGPQFVFLFAFPHRPYGANPYVNAFVQNETKLFGRELIHEAAAVTYGGHTFYRSDDRQTFGDGKSLYFAAIYTSLRDHFFGALITAGSPAELDQFADSLQRITIRDKENGTAGSELETVNFSTDRLDGHRVFLYTQKTGVAVNTVLPEFVIAALAATPQINSSFGAALGSWRASCGAGRHAYADFSS